MPLTAQGVDVMSGRSWSLPRIVDRPSELPSPWRPFGYGVAVAAAAGAALGGWTAARRRARRSGVTDDDLERPLPGDGLVPDAAFIADRAALLPAPAADVWPWLVQLGRGRGGWYLPAWAERLAPGGRAVGVRELNPEWQALAVGDMVPDWGPGEPLLRVEAIDPPHVLVFRSLRQRSIDWRWPAPGTYEGARPRDAVDLSWALALDDLGDGRSRLHTRLRAAVGWHGVPDFLFAVGGLLDGAAVDLLFAGLSERLSAGD